MRFRRDSWIMAAALVAIGFTYWFGIDRPEQLRLRALHEELVLMGANRRQLLLEAQAAADLAARLSALDAELADFGVRVPPRPELGAFVAAVSDMADRHGLREQIVSPQAPEKRGSVVVQPIRVEFVAAFEAAFEFLRGVESLPRAARVHELKLERPSPYRGDLKATLTLQVFHEAA